MGNSTGRATVAGCGMSGMGHAAKGSGPPRRRAFGRALVLPTALVATVLAASAIAADAPLRLVVYGEDAAAPLADLLTLQLAQTPGVEVLERERVAAVLQEHQLSLGGATAAEQTLKAGHLLHAGGVLLVQAERLAPAVAAPAGARGPGAGAPPGAAEPPAVRFTARLTAVAHGIVVWQQTGHLPADIAAGATGLVADLAPLLPKLRLPPGQLRRLSVAGLFTDLADAADLAASRELLLLLTHRLTREPSLLVLERDHLDKLLLEREFFAREEQAALLTGSFVLRGALRHAGGGAVHVALTLSGPSLKEPLAFERAGHGDDLPGLADAATRQLVVALGSAAAAGAWDRAAEAQYFVRQTAWAAAHRMSDVQAAAAESAWVLGVRDQAMARQRLLAYCWAANSAPFASRVLRLSQGDVLSVPGMYLPVADVATLGPRLRAAQRALELAPDFARAYPADYELTNAALLNAARVLRAWHACRRKTPPSAELVALRTRVREVYGELRRLAAEQPEWSRALDDLAFAYGAYWLDHPADALPLYRELLGRLLEGRGPHPNRLTALDQGFPSVPGTLSDWPHLLVAWTADEVKEIAPRWRELLASYGAPAEPALQAAGWVLRVVTESEWKFVRPVGVGVPGYPAPRLDRPALRAFLAQHGPVLLADPRRQEVVAFLQDAGAEPNERWDPPVVTARTPARAGPSLKVTRCFHPYLAPPDDDFDLGGRLTLIGSEAEPTFLDRRNAQFLVFDARLGQYRKVTMPGLTPDPANPPAGVSAAGSDYVFAWLRGQRQPTLYYRRGGTWRASTAEMASSDRADSEALWCGGKLYLGSESDQLFSAEGQRHAAVVSLDPASGKATVLASTRRQPPRSPLDQLPPFHVQGLYAGAAHEVMVLISVMEQRRYSQRRYAYAPVTGQWRELGELPAVASWFARVPAGLLLGMAGLKGEDYLRGLVLLQGAESGRWLVDSPDDRHDAAAWTLPADFVAAGRKCGNHALVHYDGETLSLLNFARPERQTRHELLLFRAGRRDPARVPLTFDAGTAAEARVLAMDERRCHPKGRAPGRYEELSLSASGRDVWWLDAKLRWMPRTPEGLVTPSDERGFIWFIPWADVAEYLRATGQE